MHCSSVSVCVKLEVITLALTLARTMFLRTALLECIFGQRCNI